MNVLVIGGSGLFGRKIVLHLLGDKDIFRVVSMDVNPPPAWFLKAAEKFPGKFQFRRGDIANLEEILNLIRDCSIDRIVNMAAILTGAWEMNPRLAIKVNTLGMCNVFEAARLTGIKRVVYASSVGVYGAPVEYDNLPVTEDDLPHPGNAYGLTKQLAEIVAGRYQEMYVIQSSGLRPFLGYGHGGAFPPIIKMFSDLVSLPAVGKSFITDGDGRAGAALSSADDVAALTRILVKADSSPHPLYNITTPPISMQEIAQAVKKYLPEAHITFGTDAPPADDGKHGLPSRASMARAKKDFGFEVMPLAEAVKIHINDARLEAGLQPV
jgi:nucleoside-diphosphate-sugar epimerase